MSQLKVLWDATRSSISSYQIRRMIQRQLNTSASTTQLQDQSVSTINNGSSSSINNDNTARDSPSANPNDPTLGEAIEAIRSKVLKRSYRNYTRGWRLGAISCACSASVVFLVNFIVTIYGSVYNNGENPGVLYDGDCDKVENLNTGLHLLINALSTILLGSSNYCMQCLSAPTRSEVDAAHAKGTWLDIGIPSVRNLPKISRQRVVLWLLLGASSLPLHLFYNSAVFSSISSNDYFAISVSQSFLDSDECVNCVRPTTYLSNVVMPTSTPWYFSTSVLTEERPGTETILQQLHTKARNGELERLEPADCIYNYANVIQADRRNVLLVASDDHFPPPSENPYMNDSYIYSVLQFQSNYALGAGSLDAYGWMCTGFFDPEDKPCNSVIDKIQSAPEDWRVGCFTASNPNSYTIACNNETAYPVEYCLSERAEPHCKLQFSLAIAILVTVLNFFKAVLIFYIAYTITEDPLITMGDAVASFIQNEDPTTKYTRPSLSLNTKDASHYVTGPQEYTGQRQRWKDSTSKKRRAVTFTMFLIAVITVSTLLALGIISLPDQQDKSLPALAKLGFGSINPMIVIEWGINGMIPNTLMANLAQPILSFLYFSYNSVFTAMLLGHEWCSYANKRKGLRLSSRELGGSQRSTYFLQLPYRFAIPLMILSGILHWFVSRSIFLVAIDFYSLDGYTSQSEKVCGYSPIAIIATLILGVFMVFCMITIGYTPYKAGIPLAGSCSIAMSAACHGEWAGIDGYDASMQKLQWGVVGESPDGVGLCSFSPTEVKSMEKGKVYAGFGRRRKVRDGKVETDETREIRQSQTTLVEPLTATSSELSLEKRW